MPRKIDPGTIQIGPGRRSVNEEPTDSGVSLGLSGHVGSAGGAHPASAITIDSNPPLYDANNVEGALDEISALIPPRPPGLGKYSALLANSGIPDWGVLKLNDAPLDERLGATDWGLDPGEVYGYYYRTPEPTDEDPPFVQRGGDPVTDPVFNVEDPGLIYTGGGPGKTHAGAFTRDVGFPNPMTQTMRILESEGPAGSKPVIVSGVVYPADRGVLALIRWPADGDVADFLAQDLTVRCPAAILLGSGIASGCDSTSGGIFSLGDDGSGNFDPFAFPGKATGQYDLKELHTALATSDSSPLPIVADPAAGQVRLGTDPNAGVPLVVGGIPILGGTSVATGGGEDGNFFRYRLPYLDNYSAVDGLRFTPTSEKSRYFLKPSIAEDPGIDLTQAGNYNDFPDEYWHFQVARYRHRFALDNLAILAGDPRDNGSWMLLHFKSEATFEALVRDGVTPADTDLFSANLVNWVDPEDPTNIAADDPANGFPIGSGYHLLRAAIWEDPTGADVPTMVSNDYTLSSVIDEVMYVSGIAYFIPVSLVGQVLSIDNIQFDVQDFWKHSYRTAEEGITGDAYLGNFNPAVLNVAPFSYDLDAGSPTLTVPGAVVQDAGKVRRQRIELTYQELGAFLAINGPLPTDNATYDTGANVITPDGDLDNPAFSTDAQIRLFLRRPLGHEDTLTTFLPFPSVALPEVGGSSILCHSTRGDATALYGNVETFVGSGVPVAGLESALKDTEERFLDEVYRYRADWDGTLPAADQTALLGPGLPGGTSPLDVPVRPATAAAPYDSVSWFQQRDFIQDLSGGLAVPEGQVAGLPERAPSLEYPVLSPFPSRGIFLYPQTDYSTGFRPAFPADVSAVQWDYSTVTGQREYVRAFDASFGGAVVAQGQPFLYLKVWGLQLADYAYAAPGPGSLGIAILVKVPGMTTWMDLGRNDGGGPSKQDAFQDGAGCRVLGPDTFDGVDNDSKIVYSQVKVNVGPTVNMFLSALGEVPVLVRVILKDNATGKALDFTQTTATGDPGLLRGMVGLELVTPP